MPEKVNSHYKQIVEKMDGNFQPKRVICMPIDTSKQSLRTINWAINHTLDPTTDKVILMHVYPFPFYSAYPTVLEHECPGTISIHDPGYPYSHMQEQLKSEDSRLKDCAKEFLLQQVANLKRKNIHVEAISFQGDARLILEQEINNLKPDLVIIGQRGLGVISSMMLGSVSRHLLHHVQSPIIVLPSH
ncbi:hypothetical protein BC833DRAFT_569576 [Globomyces pollinis-pini]|nr:hypothetical protein BC833DRAFT_569576 [Globomyces pollinis-pini]